MLHTVCRRKVERAAIKMPSRYSTKMKEMGVDASCQIFLIRRCTVLDKAIKINRSQSATSNLLAR